MAQRAGKNISRPRVGVTGNSKKYSPSWFFIRLAIFLSGGKAIRIRVGDSIDVQSLSGLIISGGDDIDPALYGEDSQEGMKYDSQRDSMEIKYIQHALREDLPLLGICRGHQLINTVMGGTLHLSIRKMRVKTSNRWSLFPKKRVRVKDGSRLAKLLGTSSLLVNSLHSQAISVVAEQLDEIAFDADNIIQAVESKIDRQVIGVQWHPEYLCFIPRQLRLFRWLVREAKKHNRNES
jgi:putative glutamine amidotransferase